MNDLIYVSKAQKAFEEKDYKRCVILLKRTPLKDPTSIALFVNACYTAWVHQDTNFTIQEIQESYTTLFSSTTGSLIPSYEYVRLSHIYLKIGSLHGALKTLQYAGHCNHFDSSIVTLQTWTVLRKLNQTKEAKKFFYHLCDLIPMEVPEEHENGISFIKDTDIPISICYIFCGYQLQIESSLSHRESTSTSNVQMNRNLYQKSEAMLIEAYTYTRLAHPATKSVYLNWVKTSSTWIEIGNYLEQTPCLLLAEEAYWIAFLCDPRNDERAEECFRVLENHNRSMERFSLFEKMYSYNHWNMFCRKKLVEENKEKYSPMFVLVSPRSLSFYLSSRCLSLSL
jgi:hypothetical protein